MTIMKFSFCAKRFLLFAALLLILTPCATPHAAVNQEDALKERVNTLWQAKSDNEWAIVYEMADKKFRDSVTLKKFLGGKNMIIEGFRIKMVEIEPNDVNKGSSMVIFKTYKFARPFELSVKEEWLLEDGLWNIKLSDPRTPFDTRTK